MVGVVCTTELVVAIGAPYLVFMQYVHGVLSRGKGRHCVERIDGTMNQPSGATVDGLESGCGDCFLLSR